jgi:hypothetical protein
MDHARQFRIRLCSRSASKRLLILFVLIIIAMFWCYLTMIRMPGESYSGPLPPLTGSQRALADELQRDVQKIAGDIGQRNIFHPAGYRAAADYITNELQNVGYNVERQTYDCQHFQCANLIAEIKGSAHAEEIVIVGAHYDSVDDSPAADDNCSGVAATLALARRFANRQSDRTLRFLFFANEEPPWFMTSDMGSLVYARRCKERNEKIIAMISLETIGYYTNQPGSQVYPIKPIGWLYPDHGNFIAFVGNFSSRTLVRQAIGSFRKNAQFPSEGAAMPGWIEGVGWSDQWAFWQCGYPGIMITDTAPYRYPHYHTIDDTPDKLDYDSVARVVEGVAASVASISAAQ